MKKLALIFAFALSTFACTNVFVYSTPYVAVARTMDFGYNMGNKMGFSPAGSQNVSNINMVLDKSAKQAVWNTKYPYIGQTAFGTYIIVDGINSAGVYAGFLYLPSITKYPEYNPSDDRPSLGVFDSANYILATSATIEEAIENLKNVQFVINAAPVNVGGGKIEHLPFPAHLIARDKKGSSLLIEWIDGNVKTYYHASNSTQTVEMTNFKNEVIHENFNMSTVTNAPEYSWHIKNTRKYDKLYNGNSDYNVDGVYMNGSGYVGIPGDYTPPSRLARVYTMAKFAPKPNSAAEAEASAFGLLNTVITTPAYAPDATLWISVANLQNSTYFWQPLISISTKNNMTKVAPYTISSAKPIRFDLNQMKTSPYIPRGFISATVPQVPQLSVDEVQKAKAFLNNTNTKANVKANISYEKNLAEFNKNEYDLSGANSGISFP